ncbi:hypothetical protein [Bdellovibrio sp. HCB-162]|uniref:hypothetical protein n=1 Tax=Bdellovibrio sp. HCB-162 TaxID=3394234 RepID=UPI0039BD2965
MRKSLQVKAFLLLLPFIFSVKVSAEAPKYPALREWQGQVWLTGKDSKRLQVKSKQVLREKALLETSASGSVKVQLDEKRSFTLLGSGEVSMPVISWESGEAPVVILKSGDIYWEQNPKEKGPFNVALRSDLFEFLAPPGKYILSINPGKAFSSVKMLDGSMEFSALNGEESVVVKSGQQVAFQGVLEGGEIAYDVLLKGKKIPKGHLTAVTAVDAKDMSRAADAEKKRLKDLARQQEKSKAALAQLKRDGVICTNPPGKFNECSWICTNNPKKEKKACLVSAGAICERQRCNANGDWAEKTLLDAEKASSICKAQPVVAPCDY